MAAPQKDSALQVLVVLFNLSLVIFILGEHYFPPQKPSEPVPVAHANISDALEAVENHSLPAKK